jgi:hypothetical protein
VKFYPEGYHVLLRDYAGAAHATDVAEWTEEIAQQMRFGSTASGTQDEATAKSSTVSSAMGC